MAKLYFNYGAMTSGKTIEVIETVYKYNSRGMHAVLAKPAIDTKGDTKVVSRIGMEREVDFVIKENESFFDYITKYDDITCLVVDEAQFLTERQVIELFYLVKELHLPVICYGLKVDFKGNLFEGSKALIQYADAIQELVAVCNCGRKARFNARKIDDEYVFDGEQVVIGADEKYEPMCGNCFSGKVLVKSKEYKNISYLGKKMKKS